jgi:hypothetical protein
MAWYEYSSGSDLPKVPDKPEDARTPAALTLWVVMVGLLVATVVGIFAGWNSFALWAVAGVFVCYFLVRLLID